MNKDLIILGLILLNILSLIIVNIILAVKSKKKISHMEKTWEQQFERYRNNIYEIEKENFQKILNSEFQEIKGRINAAAAQAKQLDGEIEQKKEFNSNLLKIRQEELDRLMAEKYAAAEAKIQSEIDEWAESAQEAATEFATSKINTYEIIEADYQDRIAALQAELNEYQEKREALNDEILRQRRIEEEQDFYRINLDNDALEDIELINSIRPRIKKFDLLNKLLYDNYVSRPTKEMVKRVLGGKDPSGIYKVTNIKTQEVYIGKSTTVGSRWQNHVKSACGLEGVAESQFQRALKKYGVEKFTWELLEEVDKSKLTEREKYWISFYGTTKVGYNQKVG